MILSDDDQRDCRLAFEGSKLLQEFQEETVHLKCLSQQFVHAIVLTSLLLPSQTISQSQSPSSTTSQSSAHSSAAKARKPFLRALGSPGVHERSRHRSDSAANPGEVHGSEAANHL